jgi:hypothetical protein
MTGPELYELFLEETKKYGFELHYRNEHSMPQYHAAWADFARVLSELEFQRIAANSMTVSSVQHDSVEYIKPQIERRFWETLKEVGNGLGSRVYSGIRSARNVWRNKI